MKTQFRSDELAWIEQANIGAMALGRANELLLARKLLKQGTTYMAARGRPPKIDPGASDLIDALNFVGIAGTKKIAAYNEHIQFLNHWAIMSDGQISAGHPVKVDLNCCPHFSRLKLALAKIGKSLALTQVDGKRLSVKGEDARFVVPCMIDFPDLDWDDQAYPCNDTLKDAFMKCGLLCDENATEYVEASLYMQAYICSATDTKCMLQVQHDNNVPPLALPKIFTQAVAKQKLAIVGFGYTEGHSFTIYFENGAWIKTLIYADPWPIDGFSKALDVPFTLVKPPAKLFEAIEVVAKFKDDDKEENNNILLIGDGVVQSHISDEVGAQYEVDFDGDNKQINADHFKSIGILISDIDVKTYPSKILFFGARLRGAFVCYVNALKG